nr:GNAT family N-acetyltransferase [Rubricella aquisinus]
MRLATRPRIADGTVRDAAACAEILMAWVRECGWMPRLWTDQETLFYVSRLISEGRLRVVRHGGRVAGFIATSEGEVECLYLRRGARGAGLGKRLLDDAKLRMPDGFILWAFAANTGALRFYAREGLIETDHSDGARNVEKLPDVQMTWKGSA